MTGALSSVPAAGSRRGAPVVGSMRFFYGPMDCGKSALALQIDHNHARQGRHGLLLTRHDRSGRPRISSRIGITRDAIEVDEAIDLRTLVREHWARGNRVDYLVVDEAQFLLPEQVELSARFNARVADGRVVREGDTVVVADTVQDAPSIRYQVLCRRHYRLGDLGPGVSPPDQPSLG